MPGGRGDTVGGMGGYTGVLRVGGRVVGGSGAAGPVSSFCLTGIAHTRKSWEKSSKSREQTMRRKKVKKNRANRT